MSATAHLACTLCVVVAAAVNGPFKADGVQISYTRLGWRMEELCHNFSRWAHREIIFAGVQIMRQPRCSPPSPQHHNSGIACAKGHLSDAPDGMHAAG